MAKEVIHLYGASGSGTSTLGRYISQKRASFFMDTDDYYWLPTDPPYTQKRPAPERLARMKADLDKAPRAVISGSLSGWGDELIPRFTLAIRLVTPASLRLQRLRKREGAHFGARIQPGGDMYQAHLAFIQWAGAYDQGDLTIRSKAMHDQWEKLLLCPKITLDGSEPLAHNLEIIERYLSSFSHD